MKLLYLVLLLVSIQLVCAGGNEDSSCESEEYKGSSQESSEEFCEDKGCGGDLNAIEDRCGDPCPVTCANKDKPRKCPKICRPKGCRCKDGYVRDFKNKCIKPTDCPKCKGKNEFYDCGSACDRECATLGDPCIIINKKCVEKCYCKEGYARDKNGVCIEEKKCPPKKCPTDPNAIIVPCGDPCPVTCRNKDDKGPRPCPEICILNGCKCKDGYVKDENVGKCIKAKDCPKMPKCGKNEEVVYQSCPELTCEMYFKDIKPLCMPNPKPNPVCKCKNGFVRGENKKCIKPKECCKDPNSELVSCPNPCPGGTCNAPDFKPCKVKCFSFGCQCKKGYVKKSDKDATCVTKKSCKKCSSEEDDSSSSEEETPKCEKNEKPVKENCPVDDTCKTLLQGGKAECKPNPKFKCGCRCKDGYVRGDDGKCMNSKKCCKDPNATLVQCPSSCPGGTCKSPKFAPCLAMCRAWGCQCKEGYVKKSTTDQTCVPLKSCKKECSESDSSEECDDDPKKKCGPGEEYNDCPPSCPPEVTCESYFIGIFPMCAIFIDRENCNPACRCKPDYVRNKNGKCVQPKECCTDPNSELVQGVSQCPGGTCEQPEIASCDARTLRFGCVCKNGYLKSSATDKKCVPVDSCDKTCEND